MGRFRSGVARVRRALPHALALGLSVTGCRLGYGLLDEAGAGNGGSGTSGAGAGGFGASSGSSGAAAGAGGTGAASGGTASQGGSSGASGGTFSGGGSGGVPPPLPGTPLAFFEITPKVGDTQTSFSADASASSDVEDGDNLTYEWDWESDGTYDDSGVSATHVFGAAGDYTVTLRATDSDGNSAFASELVSVVAAGDLIVVTTGVDETSDPGTGLSLREAVAYANATPGKQTITFEPGLTITLNAALTEIADSVDIFGSDTSIDGTALKGTPACVIVSATARVFELEIFGCPGEPVLIKSGTGSQVAGCYLRDNGKAVTSAGAAGSVIGPGNEVARSGTHGIYLNSPGDSAIDNVVYDSTTDSVMVGGGAPGALVAGNLTVGGRYSLDITADNVTIWHNTLVYARNSGLSFSQVAGTVMQNNIVAYAVGFGMLASPQRFAVQEHNLFFGNPSGACSSCTLGTGSIEQDPLFVDAAAGDFRLLPESPAVDSGAEIGRDVNGGEPGDFNGTAPDMGYYEAP